MSSLYLGAALDAQEVAERRPRRLIACGCGARYTDAEFAALAQRGTQDAGDGSILQLANCSCGSTIARPEVAVTDPYCLACGAHFLSSDACVGCPHHLGRG